MSRPLKMKFYESQELTKVLPNAIYHDVVEVMDYYNKEISRESILKCIEDCNEFGDEMPYTKEELTKELQNALGEDYDLLMNRELDFIQVIY